MILGLYFLIVIALPLALGAYVVYRGIPRSRRCPMCGDETLRLQSRPHELGSRLTRRSLQLRWCMGCGWCGTVRLGSRRGPRPRRRDRSRATTTPSPDRVDLRTLHVDGNVWRVMVECWAEDGRWLARLVFVAPGGETCADPRSLEGESVLDVISLAFSLPEQTLAGRLRRSIR